MTENDLNENFILTIIKELNSSKTSAEEHSANVISNLDEIITLLDDNTNSKNIKELLAKIIDDMQYQDLNRQKIERVMNLLVEKNNICKETLIEANIKLSPSAHHIDHEDGECLSDEELAAIVASMNQKI